MRALDGWFTRQRALFIGILLVTAPSLFLLARFAAVPDQVAAMFMLPIYGLIMAVRLIISLPFLLISGILAGVGASEASRVVFTVQHGAYPFIDFTLLYGGLLAYSVGFAVLIYGAVMYMLRLTR